MEKPENLHGWVAIPAGLQLGFHQQHRTGNTEGKRAKDHFFFLLFFFPKLQESSTCTRTPVQSWYEADPHGSLRQQPRCTSAKQMTLSHPCSLCFKPVNQSKVNPHDSRCLLQQKPRKFLQDFSSAKRSFSWPPHPACPALRGHRMLHGPWWPRSAQTFLKHGASC